MSSMRDKARSLGEFGSAMIALGRRMRSFARRDGDLVALRQIVDELRALVAELAMDLGVDEEN